MRTVVDVRRKEPTDDLISVLIDPNQGAVMSTQEVAGNPGPIENLVAEIIRLESSFRWMARTAMQDTTVIL